MSYLRGKGIALGLLDRALNDDELGHLMKRVSDASFGDLDNGRRVTPAMLILVVLEAKAASGETTFGLLQAHAAACPEWAAALETVFRLESKHPSERLATTFGFIWDAYRELRAGRQP